MKLTLGCTTRPFAPTPFDETCRRIAAAGYSDVAVFFDVGINADSSPEHTLAMRKVAEDAGLMPSLLIVHAELDRGLDEAVARFKRVVDHAAALGASWLLELGTGKPEYYTMYFELLDQVVPYAADAGIQTTLKPHGGVTLTTEGLIAAYERVNHPSFGISYDPGNIIYYTKGEERPEMHIAEVAPLVTTAIIKDCILVDGVPDVMVTAGDGLVDFPAVLSGLVAGGFRGPLYVECVGGKTPEEIDANVLRTRKYIQGILAGLG
ncbi:MAG: sugar phosphate isomerase/epimerase [Anaerolineales bacterium]|nr:sugar phosphate isomerase/epimerase [Anaerolineales bacterium]